MRFVDIDKVKKNLDENKPDWTAEDYAVACEDAEFYSSMEDFISEHDDEIEMMMFAPELVPDEPKWIPCAERMPDKDEFVLCFCRANITEVLYWNGSSWHSTDAYRGYLSGFVTHWMPLPEQPESEVTQDGCV